MQLTDNNYMELVTLTLFEDNVSFWHSLRTPEGKDFLMFLGGIEREHRN